MFFSYLIFLLFFIIVSSEAQAEDVYFYCRVCGAIIANSSSIIHKNAVSVDKTSVLENQKDDFTITYDNYASSKVWKDKDLVYFSKVSREIDVTSDSHQCPHFDNHKFSYMTCNHCKTQVGYYLESLEEDEEIDENEEDYYNYDEEDIKDMLAPIEDMNQFLEDTFSSMSSPIRSYGYWSYRYNHKKSVEQYHTKIRGSDDDSDFNWSLGNFVEDQQGEYGLDKTTLPPTPYFAYYYTNGQFCDEIKSPRETEVRFQPCSTAGVVKIMSIDEVSVCHYIIRICVPEMKQTRKLGTGFYALDLKSVIPSSDKQLENLINHDIYRDSIMGEHEL